MADYTEVYDLLPPYVQNAINRIPETLKVMDEKELRKFVKPNQAVDSLRTSFWLEYERSKAKNVKFLISNVIAGICTKEYFAHVVLQSSGAVEWMIRPPMSYQKAMEEALQFGLSKLREIMEMPLTKPLKDKKGEVVRDKKGYIVMEPDHKAADLVLKAFAMADLRVKGAVAQRVEMKSMHLTANVNANEMQRLAESNTMEDLDKKLKQLRAKEKELDGSVEAEFSSADQAQEV